MPGAGDPRRQRTRQGPRLLFDRRHRHHRRRPLAGLHHRHHRLPPVHAAHQGSETGETLPGEVERVGSVVWAADNRTLFYTVEDEEQKRQYQLWRHTLGTPHSADVLVYQDDDERFNLGAGRTRDGKFLVLESASHTTTESRVLPADEPNGSFTLISPREDEHEYSIDHRNGLWFIRTNDRGRNFRLVTRPWPRPAASTGPSAFPIATTSCSKSGSLRRLLCRLRARRRPAPPAHVALHRR
jgi:hypothetical protein